MTRLRLYKLLLEQDFNKKKCFKNINQNKKKTIVPNACDITTLYLSNIVLLYRNNKLFVPFPIDLPKIYCQILFSFYFTYFLQICLVLFFTRILVVNSFLLTYFRIQVNISYKNVYKCILNDFCGENY